MSDCAILAIASTTQTVRALIQRLVEDTVLDAQAVVVPWTIVNKYYTAEVQFLVHTLSSWAPIQDVLLTPAVLFVWNRGEPYRDQIRQLSQHTSQFEVALAIRLPHAGSTVAEDDQDVDAYLSCMGFEFVDVSDTKVPLPDRSGILGVPRIVDALSTIMWPSMVRQSSKCATSGFISSDDYHNLVRLVGEKISGNDGDRMQRELEALERWLDEDASSADNEDGIPWSTAVTPGTLSPSSSGFLENSGPTTPKAAFEDDFTAFVSASSPSSVGIIRPSLEHTSSPQILPPFASSSFSSTFSFSSTSSGRSTPTFDDHASIGVTRLAPGASYKSLGSMSDLGDPDKEPVTLERLSNSIGDADEDMPSRAEIAETSRRIFGTLPLSFSPTQERGDGNLHAVPALGGAPLRGYLGEEPDVEMAQADLERFDLQSVLGALQGLKEEIAAMPDEQRRKAAARVALGLAYGLGGNAPSEAGDVVI